MGRDLSALRGKVVLITGGAQGIGRKTAAAFIARGAKVAIGDLDVDLAKKTADEIGGEVNKTARKASIDRTAGQAA